MCCVAATNRSTLAFVRAKGGRANDELARSTGSAIPRSHGVCWSLLFCLTNSSSVALGHSLNLLLLLCREGSAQALGAVDDIFGQALAHALQLAEGAGACTLADEVDGLIHATEWAHIDGLPADHTTGADTCGVFAGASILDGRDQYLNWVRPGEQMDDLQGLLSDTHGPLLFAVVAAASRHDHVGQALDNGELGLLEAALLVATGRVGRENALLGILDLQVAAQRFI